MNEDDTFLMLQRLLPIVLATVLLALAINYFS